LLRAINSSPQLLISFSAIATLLAMPIVETSISSVPRLHLVII